MVLGQLRDSEHAQVIVDLEKQISKLREEVSDCFRLGEEPPVDRLVFEMDPLMQCSLCCLLFFLWRGAVSVEGE